MTGYDSLVRRDFNAEGTGIGSSTWTASLQAVKLAWSDVVFCLSNVKSILYISRGQELLKTIVRPVSILREYVVTRILERGISC